MYARGLFCKGKGVSILYAGCRSERQKKRKEEKKRKENAPLVIPSMSLASSNRRLRIPLSI